MHCLNLIYFIGLFLWLKVMQKDGPWVGTWRPHRPRGPIAAQYASPGPKYALPGITDVDLTRPQPPAFSMGARLKELKNDCSPGPKYLLSSDVNRYGKHRIPTFLMQGRPKEAAPASGPGPAEYSLEKSKLLYRTAPVYTIHGKPKESRNKTTPGPADYNLPPITGHDGPSFTPKYCTPKGGWFKDLKNSPGPAAYDPPKPYALCPKPPQCTIKGRIFPPDSRSEGPGPAAYCPEKLTFSKPKGFSFGVRHSQYEVSLVDFHQRHPTKAHFNKTQ